MVFPVLTDDLCHAATISCEDDELIESLRAQNECLVEEVADKTLENEQLRLKLREKDRMLRGQMDLIEELQSSQATNKSTFIISEKDTLQQHVRELRAELAELTDQLAWTRKSLDAERSVQSTRRKIQALKKHRNEHAVCERKLVAANEEIRRLKKLQPRKPIFGVF